MFYFWDFLAGWIRGSIRFSSFHIGLPWLEILSRPILIKTQTKKKDLPRTPEILPTLCQKGHQKQSLRLSLLTLSSSDNNLYRSVPSHQFLHTTL